MKSYSVASADVEGTIERMQAEHHTDELEHVTVKALFVYDDESSDQVLTHQGYPAAAAIRITPIRDRTLGIADSVIVIDRSTWSSLSAAQKDALIDHELQHLERVFDEDTEQPKYDAIGRPKLRIRKHDHQFGWFDAIAQRHGDSSPEVRQAKQLIHQTQQLYFDFGPASKPKGRATATAQH